MQKMSLMRSTSLVRRSLSRGTVPSLLRQSACFSQSSYMRNATADVAAPVDPKISKIVEQIATLNLLETANLVQALKVKLNIQDIVMAAPTGAAPAASTDAPAEEAKPAEAAQTMFAIKLEKFDAASKAKMIKEVKGLLPNANLVEAKKFVESVPKVLRENVPKEEAEKIKATLEALGGTVVLV